MKTGFDLLRNGALAAVLAFGVTGLTACGDNGEEQAAPPAEPSGMEEMAPEGADTGATMDEAAGMADEAMEKAEDAAESAVETMEEGADDAAGAMEDATEDAADKMGVE